MFVVAMVSGRSLLRDGTEIRIDLEALKIGISLGLSGQGGRELESPLQGLQRVWRIA